MKNSKKRKTLNCSARKEDFKADRIEGNKIILHDLYGIEEKVLKKVEIITKSGRRRFYEIRRTVKGNYLFN